MLVNFTPTTPNYKRQKTAFGNERSAKLIKSTIQTALETGAPDLKITREQAIQRVHDALRTEKDKTGKSILRKFQSQILERLPDASEGKNPPKATK